MQVKKIELLAPARNRDIGIAAVNCGADALYIAGPSFGARESASNPIEEIEALCKYAHRFNVKVYLTLNTILYDSEIERAIKLAENAYEAGCDALIIQDLGLLKVTLPPIPLFASTQTNNRTVGQVSMLESLGFNRVILARELSIAQIKDIRAKTSIELETFIHGALCVSYSGQCYLSSHITGRSANRGECAQPCRSNYNLLDGNGKMLVKNKPLLSLKDLNLSNHLNELVDAGVTSFKIEGRLKNASYIKNIVKYYRTKLDTIIEQREADTDGSVFRKSSDGKLYDGFTPRPDLTFNRGYTGLYIDGVRGKWQSGGSAKSMGEYVGKISNFRERRGGNFTFEYNSNVLLENGDGLCFVTPSGEVVGARANVVSGSVVTTNGTESVPVDSEIYRNFSNSFERELENNMPDRLLKVWVDFVYQDGLCRLDCECEDGEKCSVAIDSNFGIAEKQERSRESIKTQLGKISDIYSFEVRSINADLLPFFPISVLNNGRRALAAELDRKRDERITDERIEAGAAAALLRKSSDYKVRVSGELDYKCNISNSFSSELYKSLGAAATEMAYEISTPPLVELMRCKYCIRHELGICLKEEAGKKADGPLYLENNGKKYKLLFDCKNCEMVIFG
ncbi:MAG: U32 family peptidase [Rikenellaceae bacterium]|nr:U32 family peptidase [Rikenellaceae bacterium]